MNSEANQQPGAVVSDLGEHPGTGQLARAGEAGDDLGIRVPLNMGGRRLGEVVSGRAGGVELAQQRGQLKAHRGLDLRRLVQVVAAEDPAQPLDIGVLTGLAGKYRLHDEAPSSNSTAG